MSRTTTNEPTFASYDVAGRNEHEVFLKMTK
jgi:hypothetical protein